MINRIRKIALGSTLVALLLNARADDFLIGTHGPTDWQLDDRITYSEKSLDNMKINTSAHTTVVKHWTGDKFGWFGIGVLPYKHVRKNGEENSGFGDFTLKLGPRGYTEFRDKSSFHWILNGGISFPTGDSSSKVNLGTGEFDTKLGFTTTYLSENKKSELTTSFEYTVPEQKTRPDEIATGFIIGKQIGPKIRLGCGMTGLTKLNEQGLDYSLNARVLLRYNLSKKVHIQLLGETSVAEHNMPHGFTIGTFVRYNF